MKIFKEHVKKAMKGYEVGKIADNIGFMPGDPVNETELQKRYDNNTLDTKFLLKIAVYLELSITDVFTSNLKENVTDLAKTLALQIFEIELGKDYFMKNLPERLQQEYVYKITKNDLILFFRNYPEDSPNLYKSYKSLRDVITAGLYEIAHERKIFVDYDTTDLDIIDDVD